MDFQFAKRKMNKKGEDFLNSEVVKIIIAIICISFLIYFGVLVYQVAKERSQARQATSTLTDILSRSEKMKVGDQASYLYLSPKGYYFSFSDENNKLAQCAFKYCLCLCDRATCSDFNICQKSENVFALYDSNGKSLTLKPMETPKTIIITRKSDLYEIREN